MLVCIRAFSLFSIEILEASLLVSIFSFFFSTIRTFFVTSYRYDLSSL